MKVEYATSKETMNDLANRGWAYVVTGKDGFIVDKHKTLRAAEAALSKVCTGREELQRKNGFTFQIVATR